MDITFDCHKCHSPIKVLSATLITRCPNCGCDNLVPSSEYIHVDNNYQNNEYLPSMRIDAFSINPGYGTKINCIACKKILLIGDLQPDDILECPFCGTKFIIRINERDFRNMIERKKKSHSIIAVMIISVILALVLIYFAVRPLGIFNSPEATAFMIVKKYLKSPSTAQMVESNLIEHAGNKYLVFVAVDAQNSFGASLRESYLVTFKDEGGGKVSWKDLLSPYPCSDPPTSNEINAAKNLNDWPYGTY
jgi:DNA-directed RNA polymerase subunit RPC12/RpoP